MTRLPLSPKGEPAVNWTFVQIRTGGPGASGGEPLQALEERRVRGVQASRCPPPHAPPTPSHRLAESGERVIRIATG